MTTQVYYQAVTAKNRPLGRLDAQGRTIPESFADMEFKGDLAGGSSLVYVGLARPGSATSGAVWQIRKLTYSGSTVIGVSWPQDSNSHASNDYQFVWDNRASYTYS